ncbi:aminobenzoate synthetase [Bacillus sp. FJAT-18017]|uniref:aminodeoxychorismate synthase component I n=1 Tax=Bacillus sp. FJAT-18017 TaxID=1705566 RepID=UPI0006B0002A|nr:aminodeoxychorismate synthase component I [Bacillus sp. FJAT-18017]ALC92653.1 aminobenzoate synthetase [Bacillus sp. FJAT-18017]
MESLLSFEFEGRPVTFRNPVRVIAAHTLEEVVPGLQAVEDAVRDGFYAAGYVSYESAPAFDSAFRVASGARMPLLWFGIFEDLEHVGLSGSSNYQLSEWLPSVGMDEYRASIRYIRQAIEAGDTYQANYTLRLKSEFSGDDVAFFERLKKAQDSSYCAYLDIGDFQILSASPELFFHKKGSEITTRPMKGTIKRGRSFAEDEANAMWLFESEKNRSENVMIVDLLRNDLGMIAEPGTIEVPKLFEIERYPTVHQMTSTVTAQVSEDVGLVDVFRALFPCGSITGAPKVSTMGIIAELENTPREVYCGAIGYITPESEAVFNVPIRTVVIDSDSGVATYGVGGGITWDSTAEDEYEEVVAKAKLLEMDRPEFELLESLLLEDGKYFLYEEHLERLRRSAKYLGFNMDWSAVEKALAEFAESNPIGSLKVRLLVARDGAVSVEGQAVSEMAGPVKVRLAGKPIDKNDPCLYHKTTNRAVYASFFEERGEAFDVLLWNQDGELTEFTNGNVVVELDDELWTPPVASGLLAGTYRKKLLSDGVVRERVLRVEDLEKYTKIWFVNSVRKWVEVQVTEKY